MNIQELSTCKQFRMPLKVMQLNNGYLGMVRQWQELIHGNRYPSPTWMPCPIFRSWPKPMATSACAWTSRAMWKAPCARPSSSKNDLVFLDFQVDQTENVYPMVMGGKGLTDMILSSEDL
jgi:acetolactate synthase-1/2/3 large subunit